MHKYYYGSLCENSHYNNHCSIIINYFAAHNPIPILLQ